MSGYRFKRLFGRKLNADMAEERQAQVERRTPANLGAGKTSDEAHHSARWQFGGREQLKEVAREQRGWIRLDQLGQELRYAARQLRRDPGFAATVGRGARLVGYGLAFGLLGAFGGARVLASRPQGAGGSDSLVFGGAALLLAIVGFVACWLPARRATKVDPVAALRAE